MPKGSYGIFETLTSGGETVVATNFTKFGAMYIVEVARVVAVIVVLYGWVLLPRTRVRPLDILERRRR